MGIVSDYLIGLIAKQVAQRIGMQVLNFNGWSYSDTSGSRTGRGDASEPW